MSAQPQQKTIYLDTLPLQNLVQMRQDTEQKLSAMDQLHQQLKVNQEKIMFSRESVLGLKEEKKDNEILIPMTSSLYVKGTLGNTDNILVDIGTGYHVKKNIDGTIDFLDRRNKVLRESVDKLQEKMGEMTKTFDVLTAVINEKAQQEQEAQESQKK